MKNKLLIIASLLVALNFGCGVLFHPNTRVFVKDKVILSARYNREEKAFGQFHLTEIGMFWAQEDPENTMSKYIMSFDSLYQGTPAVFFKWEDGFCINISSSNAAKLVLSHPDLKPLSPYTNLPKEVKRVELLPLNFFIMSNKIVRVRGASHTFNGSEVKVSTDGKTFYQFPLSEAGAVAVFGSPDKLFDKFIH